MWLALRLNILQYILQSSQPIISEEKFDELYNLFHFCTLCDIYWWDFYILLELFDQKYKRMLTYAALVWKSIKTVQTLQWDIQNFFYYHRIDGMNVIYFGRDFIIHSQNVSSGMVKVLKRKLMICHCNPSGFMFCNLGKEFYLLSIEFERILFF